MKSSASQMDLYPPSLVSMREHEIVSLFSGCGGMDIGFLGGFEFCETVYEELPYRIVYANDIDTFACRAYRRNVGHEIVHGDIRAILEENSLPEKADVLLGGFPCQDFSTAGRRRGFRSERGLLYRSMVEVARRLSPQVFIAENVSGLTTLGGALKKIKGDFAAAGFVSVTAFSVQCADYGIPQSRKRVFIIGWRHQEHADRFVFPPTTERPVTVQDAIGDLEDRKWGEVDGHTWSRAKFMEGLQGNTTTPADGIAYAVRAEHHGNIEFHYSGDRRLSVREVTRLQTFPDEFIFGDISQNQGYKMIGNAVPPVMAWHIANAVNEVLST